MGAPFARTPTLLRVSKASRKEIDAWFEGIYLEESSSRSIEALRQRAVGDRLLLARRFNRSATAMLAMTTPRYRDAVSRSYYGMYHAVRAVSFFCHGGDDHESHQKLPGFLPQNFPESEQWRNALKDARERRNAADYDPYPKTEGAWRADAEMLTAAAANLYSVSHAYLKARGCGHLP